MAPRARLRIATALCCCAAMISLAAHGRATSKHFHTLYSFTGGADGALPTAGLIGDGSGNFYGAAQEGGTGCSGFGCGTVFSLASDGSLTVLYTFQGGSDGAEPLAGLFADGSGHLFGSTNNGGTGCSGSGCGTIYEITRGAGKLLHQFSGGSDGSHPQCTLIEDRKGNLLGTTVAGGAEGDGTVFRLTRKGVESVLYSFSGADDGASPVGGLVADQKGDLFGTTSAGGADGAGTVFEIRRAGSEATFHSFTGGSDGAAPVAGLISDSDGNLYGTANTGGALGFGNVFKFAPNGEQTVLHAFGGGSDGQNPAASLVMDANGNLYGTTTAGGRGSCNHNHGCGTVFEISHKGRERILYTFAGMDDGAVPRAPLLLSQGHLYGTASQSGGDGDGTAFELNE